MTEPTIDRSEFHSAPEQWLGLLAGFVWVFIGWAAGGAAVFWLLASTVAALAGWEWRPDVELVFWAGGISGGGVVVLIVLLTVAERLRSA